MVLESLAEKIVGLVNWGIAILVIMLFIEIFRFIGGGKKDVVTEGGRKILDWGGGKLKNLEHRQKTRLLSEFIEEEKGLKDLEKVEESLEELTGVLTSGKEELIKEKSDQLAKAFSEAEGEFRKIKRATWRADTKLDTLLKTLKERGMPVDKIKVLENSVLTAHQETRKALGEGHEFFEAKFVPLLKQSVFDVAKAKVALTGIKPLLDYAKKQQEKAFKDVEGIIAQTRELWK